jgi:hypothetical protein
MSELWPWVVLFGLGAYHGINPAMGWLFAVALGLQEKSRRAVLQAIPPIALGHVLSIGIVVCLLWLAQASIPQKPLRYGAAAIVFGFALYRLIRSRHPRWVGMRVGFRDLTLWSFLMASAHGAGLMLVPILLAWPQANADQLGGGGAAMSHAGHLSFLHLPASGSRLQWPAAVAVHSIGYLSVAAFIALLVYEKLGVAILRRAWFNLDLVWFAALMVSGAVIILV